MEKLGRAQNAVPIPIRLKDPHLLPHQTVLTKTQVKVKSLSRVHLLATPWTVAYHSPPAMGFSRQGYWSGLQFPTPEDLPNPGIKPRSPTM